MDKTIVFLDDGFLSKLSRHLGRGDYIRFDRIKFSEVISEKERLECKHIFYYNAPPFQSDKPTSEEEKRKKGYDKFISKLIKNNKITIREGRCQRLKIDGKFIYKQKAVDSLAIIDLMNIPLRHKDIKNIIIVSSDSDFVPAIENLKEFGVKTILYTYYEKKRDTNFSRSNELVKSVGKYVLLKKEDFERSKITKYLKEVDKNA